MARLTHRTVPGFTYFVTTKTWQSRSIFQVPENAEILLESLLKYRDKGAYLLHEFVVMPDHLHLLVTPADDTSLERAMMLVKGGSSHEIHRRRELKLEIWQAGFHEESVRDENDYAGKTEYIHMNPVRARLVDRPEDWSYGSACKRFSMDSLPERLKTVTSGAKAPLLSAAIMSDLKVRPPKNLRPPTVRTTPKPASLPIGKPPISGAEAPSPTTLTRGLKSPPPENLEPLDSPLPESSSFSQTLRRELKPQRSDGRDS